MQCVWLKPGVRGFSLAAMSVRPATFTENKRKMEPEDLPNCTILLLLITYTRQLEVLATALG